MLNLFYSFMIFFIVVCMCVLFITVHWKHFNWYFIGDFFNVITILIFIMKNQSKNNNLIKTSITKRKVLETALPTQNFAQPWDFRVYRSQTRRFFSYWNMYNSRPIVPLERGCLEFLSISRVKKEIKTTIENCPKSIIL